jgi:hypothetical protein
MIITLQKAQNQCKSRASYSFNIDLINLCSLRDDTFYFFTARFGVFSIG